MPLQLALEDYAGAGSEQRNEDNPAISPAVMIQGSPSDVMQPRRAVSCS